MQPLIAMQSGANMDVATNKASLPAESCLPFLPGESQVEMYLYHRTLCDRSHQHGRWQKVSTQVPPSFVICAMLPNRLCCTVHACRVVLNGTNILLQCTSGTMRCRAGFCHDQIRTCLSSNKIPESARGTWDSEELQGCSRLKMEYIGVTENIPTSPT